MLPQPVTTMNKSKSNTLPKILIVDDRQDQLLFLEILLKNIDANIIKAYSAMEALEKTEGEDLALAIVDVMMPTMNGYELASKLNAERPKEKIPIIFLTAYYTSEDQINTGYESGAVDYIIKPFNDKLLKSKIKVFLDLYNQKQKIKEYSDKLKRSHDKLTRLNKYLKASEEKYRTLLNASPDGIFITDLDGIITDVSGISLELLGFTKENDVMGRSFYDFVTADEREKTQEIIGKTINEGLVQNVEVKIKRRDNSFFLSEISGTLIQGPENEPFSFMIIARDISQRKKFEKKQIHADRMASLGEMAAGIAHEINQPLNTISLILDNILYETSQQKQLEEDYLSKKLNKTFNNIERIRNIIDHIRVFSRSDEDKILTRFDINTSIRNAVSMMSEQMKHHAIRLNLSLAENLPAIIGNTYRFEQVILNILSNAKDAIFNKKSKNEHPFEMIIDLKSYFKNQCLIVEITDNGEGIKEEDIEYLMLPFYTTKDTGKGTGLGLYISYQIISEMKGTIEIISKVDQGTTFKILLKEQNKYNL